MIFYLGQKVHTIDNRIRVAKNKLQQFHYGYHPDIDTIVISKDGTLGSVYNIGGINIGLPDIPSDKKKIQNAGLSSNAQRWKREEIPQGLNENNWWEEQFSDYITEQFRKREEGIFIYIKGELVYLTGTYWHFLQWYREEAYYPNLRIIQNELMIFWEACKADERCYGMDYVKNRRFGASALGNNELLESASIHENKILGMISKKGSDAKKIFNRLVRAFKRYPPFYKPETDGTSTPKTELVFTEQNRRRKKGETIKEGQGLDTIISWHNTEMNAMDGEKIFRSLLDESGKYPPEVPFSNYWYIVKTSHRIGSNIVGKSMVVSTVNAMKKGGSEFKKIWDDSNPLERNQNGQTKSGLYRIFIDSAFCLEGFFDNYGFSIVEDPKIPTLNDLGKSVKQGSVTFLKNEYQSLKNDPEKQNEFLRQFPRTERDAFRDQADMCWFNLMKIQEQLEHNEFELNDGQNGNKEVERGNFVWKNGVPDTEVLWYPDPDRGRFWIAKDYHPPKEIRNIKEMKNRHGILAYAPINEHIGCLGVDPYNRSRTTDGRGSNGSIHLCTKYNTAGFINNSFILEYIDRPQKVEHFYEDVIMAMVYFSMPILPELSSEKFSQYIVDRKYRHFVLNNPFKRWSELSYTEKEFGGIPAQDTKVGERQYFAVESYIEDFVGIARDDSNRVIGEMGFMPFSRTLTQWKDVDPQKRTKYDAYISSSLALLGNQSRLKMEVEERKSFVVPFKKYDNTGVVSSVRS